MGKSKNTSNGGKKVNKGSKDTQNKKKWKPETDSSPTSKLSSLQQQFKKKLEGARFRQINERLYTCRGAEALSEFTKEPALFEVYHEGFRKMAEEWPENPLCGVIRWIRQKNKKHVQRNPSAAPLVVADMGCGEGRLGLELKDCNKVHSFDLVAPHAGVTACDIAHVPLKDKEVDIVVFCLALMGTNIGDFIEEAHRILKVGGLLKIVEVKSRFHEAEKDGLRTFTRVLKRAGFDVVEGASNEHNTMFFVIECTKSTRMVDVDQSYSAKPCIYKRR